MVTNLCLLESFTRKMCLPLVSSLKNSLGARECYHFPIRTSYKNKIITYALLNKDFLLPLSLKAMNFSLGPEGSITSSLVFGDLPQIVSVDDDKIRRSKLLARATSSREARKEMDTIMYHLRLNIALQHDKPLVADVSYLPAEENRLENQISNRIGE